MDPVDQLTAGGVFPHCDCGEACVCSVLFDAGRPQSIRAVEGSVAAHGDNPASGTDGYALAAALRDQGVACSTSIPGTPASGLIAVGAARGLDRWLVGMDSDHYGNPLVGSGLGHWFVTDGQAVMNPLGGRLLNGVLPNYIAAQSAAAWAAVVEVSVPLGSQPQVVGIGGDMNAYQAQALAEVISRQALGRPWDSASVNALAGAFLNGNAEAAAQQLEATPEAVDWQQRLWAVVQAVRATGDSSMATAFAFGRDWSVPGGWAQRFAAWSAQLAGLEASPGLAPGTDALIAEIVRRLQAAPGSVSS